MTRLNDLYDQQGQSPWLDNLRRGWISSGEVQAWIDRGVRGLTSNPTIFAKAMMETDDYDSDLTSLVQAGSSVDDARSSGAKRSSLLAAVGPRAATPHEYICPCSVSAAVCV